MVVSILFLTKVALEIYGLKKIIRFNHVQHNNIISLWYKNLIISYLTKLFAYVVKCRKTPSITFDVI